MSLFSDAILATDADLAKYEHTMPDLARRMKAYDGKRELAKIYLGKRLRQRGVDLDKISDPTQLNAAAVFAELHLTFHDLSDQPESIAHVKAEHYSKLFEGELELLVIDLADGTEVTPTVSSIPCYRA